MRLASPFLLRTAEPPLARWRTDGVRELRRIGKRIAIGLERRSVAGAASHDCRPAALAAARRQARPAATQLAAFDFADGSPVLTEAGTKRRASLHVVQRDAAALRLLDPGGIDVLASDPRQRFEARSPRRITRSSGR